MTERRKSVSDEEIGRIAIKISELFRRIKEGTRDSREIEVEIQRLIEGIPEFSPETIRKMANKCNKIHQNGGGMIIGGSAQDKTYIGPKAILGGASWIRSDDVVINDEAIVYGNIVIDGKVKISGSACVFGHAWLMDNVVISGKVIVICRKNPMLHGNLVIRGSGITVIGPGSYRDGVIIVQ